MMRDAVAKMSGAQVIRWSGLATLLGGVLYVAGALLHPVGEGIDAVQDPRWVPSHLVYWVAVLLFHFGLVGLYARLVGSAGRLGLAAFILAFVGTAFIGGLLLYVSTVLPVIADEAPGIFDEATETPIFLVPVFVLGFGLGWILMGVTILRTRVVPRWSGLLLMLGVTLFVLSEGSPLEETPAHVLVTLGDILFGVGLVVVGYSLWLDKR